jgi:hypothetical protein
MAYRQAHTKAAELLGLGALGMGAFALAVANDTVRGGGDSRDGRDCSHNRCCSYSKSIS